ncbi:hypothetical protein DL771_006700 [Monosporascus sp. 5C6A]|nr:hypothetical protein DL771_006700 [Monosporascus sp. 5C6A]
MPSIVTRIPRKPNFIKTLDRQVMESMSSIMHLPFNSGLAASVAGLLSLGLQITGGIVKYLDAFESRREELAYVRQQNDALTSTLLAIETASSSFQGQRPEFTAAVTQTIQSCKKELSAVEVLRVELADGDTTTWTMRLENKKKKLTYAFHRSKVQQLGQRLQQANKVLQLTLTGLGLQQQEVLGRVEAMLEKLQQQNERSQSMEALARRAAGKPAALKELCDSIQTLKQSHSQGFPLDKPARHSQNRVVAPFQNSLFTSTTGRVCICPRPHRLTAKRGIRWGHVYLSGDWQTQGHWPSCPLSTAPSKNRLAVGLKYTGVARILKSVIDVSFALTSGAGGFSISPNFTYYPTVDSRSDPAFRIMDLIGRFFIYCPSENREPFMVACLRKLVRLLDEKKAYPTALSDRNENLIYAAALAVRYSTLRCYGDSRGMSPFPKLIQTLLSYGVPAFTYNTQGVSPLLQIGLHDFNWIQEVIDVLVQANSGSQPAALSSPPRPYCTDWDGLWTIDAIPVYDRSYGFAEACDCGPLSMAVIRNDVDEVTRILSRFPGSLAELDVYGQSPFHLAAAKPRILTLLVKAADLSQLDQYDIAGVSVVEAAMLLSSTQCINGRSSNRCRRRVEANVSRSPEEPQACVENDEAEGWGWIYYELTDQHLEHGGDLFLRSPTGPPVIEYSSNVGLFGAHYAFYMLGTGMTPSSTKWQGVESLVPFNKLSATVIRRNLTDGCQYSLAEGDKELVDRDDVDIINEEQAPLLELHEKLVAEFGKKALIFIEDGSDGRPLFPQFWASYWIVRIKEELEKLDGHELTDAEKRGAEEIGVRWCEPAEKEKHPYEWSTLEYYFYELDLLCPEYKEPWPEGLRRVTELP